MLDVRKAISAGNFVKFKKVSSKNITANQIMNNFK